MTDDRHAPFFFRLGLVVMLLLLVLAAWFWRERTGWLDVAYQSVLLIRDGSVQVQVYRFGAAVVQALPLLGLKLGMALNGILWLYSISFVLVFLGFFLLISRVFKDGQLALALVFLYTLMAFDGFYWCTSELQQGLGFLLVVWAFIRRYPALDQGWHWLVLVLCLVALAFYHPLVFIPFFFCWVYLGYTGPQFRHGRYGLLALLMVAILWGKQMYFPNWYDAGKTEVFLKHLLDDFPNYFSYPAYGKFFKHLLWYWWGALLLWLVTTLWLLAQKRWLEAAFIAAASAGFVVLSALGSPNATYRFYAEVNYWPLVLFSGVPFCTQILPRWAALGWFRWSVAGLLALRLLCVFWAHQPFTARQEWLAHQLASARQSQPTQTRFYAPEQQAHIDTLWMSWATPYETLLMSAGQHPDSAATLIITPDPGRFREQWNQEGLFISEFQTFPSAQLPARYFRLGSGTYQPAQ